MPDKQLSLNQQLALLPVSVPDAVVDFLEDFNYGTPLQIDASRQAFDPEYLKTTGDQLKADLEKIRAEGGKLLQVQVDQAGRDIPGGFLLKLNFENGVKGIGLLTRLKERTILRVLIQPGAYDDAALKALLKNPSSL